MEAREGNVEGAAGAVPTLDEVAREVARRVDDDGERQRFSRAAVHTHRGADR